MKAPRTLLVLAIGLMIAGCAPLMMERSEELDARHRLDRGLAALDAAAYAAAFDDLTWVYSHCPGREAGMQALLALAALELDARNPMARPAVGTELLARAITTPGTPQWVRPLTETTFLTALALGAPHPDGGPDASEDAGPVERPDSAVHDGTPDAVADTTVDADPVPADDDQEEHLDDHVAPPPAPAGADETAHGCGASLSAEGAPDVALPTLPGPSMAALLSRAESRRDSLATRADALQRQLTAAQAELQATREELERIRKTLQP